MSREKVIVVRELTKIYNGGVIAVDHISFDVFKGEIFGFLGPNGAGKTTTINMLNTLIPPTSGSANVYGYELGRENDKIRRVIGLVPQELTADDELTGWENIMLQASLYGLNRDEAEEKARLLLDIVDLSEAADRLVRTYSGGMRRRLELVMGLIHEPKILFLDEPTLGLDVHTRAKIWEYIRWIQKEYNMTIFMTTHYMEEADQLCDRIAIIDHGKIIALGTPDELKKNVEGDVIIVKILDPLNNDVKVDSLSKVKSYKITGDKITIQVDKGEEALPEILEYLMSKGVKIVSIEVVKPSLEQVFLALTGRSIREEGGEDMIRYRVMMRRRRR